MTPSEERAYTQGSDAAIRRIIGVAIVGMPEGSTERWRLERGAVVALLRRFCADFGDNDWPDDLHLADVIEKHLMREVYSNCRPKFRAAQTEQDAP